MNRRVSILCSFSVLVFSLLFISCSKTEPRPFPQPTPAPTQAPQPSSVLPPTPTYTPPPASEPTPIIERYLIDEPYNVTETYYVQEPLSYDVIKSFVEEKTMTQTSSINIGGIPFGQSSSTQIIPIYEATVVIKNTDNVSGTFEATFFVEKPFDDFFLKRIVKLDTGQTGSTMCPAYTLGNWSYKIVPSTKEIEKERTVTKYRKVEKTREVYK